MPVLSRSASTVPPEQFSATVTPAVEGVADIAPGSKRARPSTLPGAQPAERMNAEGSRLPSRSELPAVIAKVASSTERPGARLSISLLAILRTFDLVSFASGSAAIEVPARARMSAIAATNIAGDGSLRDETFISRSP